MVSPAVLWSVFAVFVIAMLILDFRCFSGKDREPEIKQALLWSAFWIALSLAFNAGVYFFGGHVQGVNFLTGYLVEKALSMDNIFVFILIFQFFHVPAKYQRGVLFWGIVLALVFRAVFIAAGVAIINTFHWSIYVLGAFLVIVGIKMIFTGDKHPDLARNPILRLVRRFVPVVDEYHGHQFFTRHAGVLAATPLFLVFLMIAAMDVVFAVDSIPAILAITTDPFVVYTSNVFAILGLRALFSAIAALAKMFHYLNFGLSFILVFIGVKMIGSDMVHLPVSLTLGVVLAVLTLSVLASVFWPKAEKPA